MITALGAGAPPHHRLAHALAQHRWRGAGRLRARRLPPRADLVVGRRRLTLDLSERAEQRIYRGLYERAEFEVLSAVVGDGDTCVDVGANIGLVTLLLAERAARVIAVEPNPAVLDRLRAATAAIPSVEVLGAAVGDTAGELPLDIGRRTHAHATLSTIDAGGDGDTTCVTVPVTTLDAIARERGLERLDVVKIDVEGWEDRVVRGASRLFSEGRIGAALFEVNPQWDAVPDVGALVAAGYSVFVVSARNRGLRWRTVLEPWRAVGEHANAIAVDPGKAARLEHLVV